jgi:hypothetical protein
MPLVAAGGARITPGPVVSEAPRQAARNPHLLDLHEISRTSEPTGGDAGKVRGPPHEFATRRERSSPRQPRRPYRSEDGTGQEEERGREIFPDVGELSRTGWTSRAETTPTDQRSSGGQVFVIATSCRLAGRVPANPHSERPGSRHRFGAIEGRRNRTRTDDGTPPSTGSGRRSL